MESQAGCFLAILDAVVVSGVVFWLLGGSLEDPWLGLSVIGVWTIMFALRSSVLYAVALGPGRPATRRAITATAIHLLFAGIAYGAALAVTGHEVAVAVAAAACLIFSWASTGWFFDEVRREAERNAPASDPHRSAFHSGEARGLFGLSDDGLADGGDAGGE